MSASPQPNANILCDTPQPLAEQGSSGQLILSSQQSSTEGESLGSDTADALELAAEDQADAASPGLLSFIVENEAIERSQSEAVAEIEGQEADEGAEEEEEEEEEEEDGDETDETDDGESELSDGTSTYGSMDFRVDTDADGHPLLSPSEYGHWVGGVRYALGRIHSLSVEAHGEGGFSQSVANLVWDVLEEAGLRAGNYLSSLPPRAPRADEA